MSESIEFKGPCGHLTKVIDPKTAPWDKLVCATIVDGNLCGKKVNRRNLEPEKPAEITITAEDIQLLKGMKISI